MLSIKFKLVSEAFEKMCLDVLFEVQSVIVCACLIINKTNLLVLLYSCACYTFIMMTVTTASDAQKQLLEQK